MYGGTVWPWLDMPTIKIALIVWVVAWAIGALIKLRRGE